MPYCYFSTDRDNQNVDELMFNAVCCSGSSAENLAVIRHIGINLLSRDKDSKVGVKTRRLQAGWDDNYLKTVLSALNIVTA